MAPADIPFFQKSIIRLADDKHIPPFSDEYGLAPAAFLPGVVGSELPSIKPTITETREGQEFLKALGFGVPEIVDEVLKQILPRYGSPVTHIPQSYLDDIRLILVALKTDSEAKKRRLHQALQDAYWVAAENAKTGQKGLCQPRQVYFRSQNLEMYFDGNPSAWFLGVEIKDIQNALDVLTVAKRVRITYRVPDDSGYISLWDSHGSHRRGLNGFDPDTNIDGLEYALGNPTAEKSLFIWNTILIPNKHLLKGFVELATRQDYSNSNIEMHMSDAGCMAAETAWLPSQENQFHNPSELPFDALYDRIEKDEELARILDMKLPPRKDTVKALADAVGVDIADLDYLRNNITEFQEFRKWKKSRQTPKRPVAETRNRSRRDEKIKEAVVDAPPVEREQRTLTVRISKPALRPEIREYLRNLNTNGNDELICQLCHQVMPFETDDGYYFEAVECVWGLQIETHENHLALCPNCAAKYEHANKFKPEEIKELILNAGALEITLILAGEEHSVLFTQTHLEDLKVILRRV